MSSFLRTHAFALCFAVIVGILTVLPSVLAPLALHDDYKGIQFIYLDDEDIYRARIHEILDGHPRVAAPFLYEYKNDPVIMLPINEYVYAIPALVFGLSFVMVAGKFLFPALLFLLVYMLAIRLIPKEKEHEAMLVAICAGLLVVFGPNLLNYSTSIPLLMGTGHHEVLLLWTRTVNPIIGAVMLFGYLTLLWCVTLRKYRYAYIWTGVTLAITVGYFFTFAIALSILGALMVIALVRKEYPMLKELCYVFLTSLVLDSPYWFNTLTAIGGKEGRAFAERNGMYFTHTPVFNKILICASLFFGISFLYAYVFKKDRVYIKEHVRTWLFLLALLIGSWLAFNQQVITGREIWYHHFVQYTIPLALLVCIITSFLVWRRFLYKLWLVAIFMSMAICLWLGLASASSYEYKIADFRTLQHYAPFFTMLDASPKDCVVLIKESDEEFERLIPAYSHCNVYTTTSAFFGITKERIVHNYLLRIRLLGIDSSQIHEYLIAHEDEVRGYFFTNWDQQFGHGEEPWILERIASLEETYKQFSTENLKKQLLTYKMDYLVSKEPLPPSLVLQLPGITLVNQVSGYFVYAFEK